MSEQSQREALVALIAAQRGKRDRSAIREALIRDGADAALVDQALAQVFDAAPTPAPTAQVYDAPAEPRAPERLVVPEPANVERIRAYLEQHRDRYDREALRRQLLTDGQSREAVDLAIAQVFGLQVTAAPNATPVKTGTRTVVLTFLGLTLLNLVAATGLGYIATDADQLALALVPGLLLIGLEIAAMVYYRPRNRPRSRGIMWALIIALPFVAFGLLLGWCVALLQNI